MEFKFTIGDIVYHKIPVAGKVTPLFILERHLRESSGGVHRSYFCRLGCLNTIYLNEVELVGAAEMANLKASMEEASKETALLREFVGVLKPRDA